MFDLGCLFESLGIQIVSLLCSSLLEARRKAYTLILIIPRQYKALVFGGNCSNQQKPLLGNFKAMYFMLLTLQYDSCSSHGSDIRQGPICTSHVNPHYANALGCKPQAAPLSSQRSVNRSLTVIYCAGKVKLWMQSLPFIAFALVLLSRSCCWGFPL